MRTVINTNQIQINNALHLSFNFGLTAYNGIYAHVVRNGYSSVKSSSNTKKVCNKCTC